MAEAAKEEAVRLAKQLSELQLVEVCAGLSLTPKDGKTDRKKALKNCLVRYLESEELEERPDEGLSVFEKLVGELSELIKEDLEEREKDKLLKLKTVVTDEVKVGGVGETANLLSSSLNDGSTSNSTRDPHRTVETRIDLSRIKLGQFKIHSGAVGGGGEGMLDFDDLVFQMEEGRRLGHTREDVRSAVIRAMKPGSDLKRFFRGRTDMSDEDFIGFIRDDYGVKNSQTLMDEMVASAQEPTQTEIRYLMKMMGLRDHILEVTKKEETPQPEELVYKRFFHALSVGFSNPTIRIELRPLLRIRPDKTWITDRELSHEVRDFMTREEENRKKMKGREATACMLNTGGRDRSDTGGRDRSKSGGRSVQFEEDPAMKEVAKLASQVSELSVARDKQIEGLQQQMSSMQTTLASAVRNFNEAAGILRGDDKAGGGSTDASAKRGKKPPKCAVCEPTGAYCLHCLKCGKLGHKAFECTGN